MKTLRLLTLALSLGLLAACAGRNNEQADQTSGSDSVEAPGVGAALDNSRTVSDSMIQQTDTTKDTTLVNRR